MDKSNIVESQTLRLREWMTYAEAAKKLDLSPGSVRVYASRGVFDRRYIGGEFPVLSRKSVMAYSTGRQEPGNPEWIAKGRSTNKEKKSASGNNKTRR